MAKDKGTATNREGLGSTYAGTQTPDGTAPDGYQQPTVKETKEGSDKKDATHKHELGKEYDSKSSFGDKDSEPDKKGIENGESNSEEGSPIH